MLQLMDATVSHLYLLSIEPYYCKESSWCSELFCLETSVFASSGVKQIYY